MPGIHGHLERFVHCGLDVSVLKAEAHFAFVDALIQINVSLNWTSSVGGFVVKVWDWLVLVGKSIKAELLEVFLLDSLLPQLLELSHNLKLGGRCLLLSCVAHRHKFLFLGCQHLGALVVKLDFLKNQTLLVFPRPGNAMNILFAFFTLNGLDFSLQHLLILLLLVCLHHDLFFGQPGPDQWLLIFFHALGVHYKDLF